MIARGLFCLVVLLAAGLPLPRAASVDAAAGFPGWPTHWQGRALQPLPLTRAEAAFARDFPGRIARFTDGERELLLRWLSRPTRKLHPAALCLRYAGADIEPPQLQADAAGELAQCFTARLDGRALKVCEQIRGSDGSRFTDASSWYWQAWLGRSAGPWLAVTELRPLAGNLHDDSGMN